MRVHKATNWRPTASLATLKERAAVLSKIRSYFANHQVLEVETPCLSASTVTDPYLDAFQVGDKYLQTSPEYAMKRLLAQGTGDIYQIIKAFRNDEVGRFHNPEFTLLEWYRLDFSLADMFHEIDQLLQLTLDTEALDQVYYVDLFRSHLAVDIHQTSDPDLYDLVQQHCHGLTVENRDDCLTSLFATCIEPKLGQNNPCVVSHFPASQASLARLDDDDPRVARRFEVYYQGVELANGFHELTDPAEQASRFHEDNEKRRLAKQPIKPIDQRLLDALHSGLPDCVGVALGIDRLMMLKLRAQSISDVLSFDYSNA